MNKEILITEEGLEKLQKELDELRLVRRPDVISRIKTAKEYGDLSENSEYTAAKDDQSFVEGRIQELETLIKHSKVVVNGHGEKHAAIEIGCKVTVEVDGEKDSFEIVGPTESDPARGRISTDSPVGQTLMGRKVNDRVAVETPDGKVSYKIIAVD